MALFSGRSSARAGDRSAASVLATPGTTASAAAPGGSALGSPAAARMPTARWRDLRVLLGLGLVVGCVLLGVRLVSAGDDRVLAWQATRDLAAGTRLAAADLIAVPVALGAADTAYLSAGTEPDGTLLRDLGAGELVPTAAVGSGVDPDLRLVTLAVEPLHGVEGLAPGARVDVWSTPRDDLDGGLARPTRVLTGVLVAGLAGADSGLAGETGVVVEVRPSAVPALVAAARSGVIDLVRAPEAGHA